MKRLILGTAGHIDHGKTTLVKALTGVDTDRLPEEKLRGITIDLGFAHLRLGELDIGIVDVPGHEALVRNMLAGATGFDALLLVIAADEGVMPQTREHVAIARLLDVREFVVAITKADVVDPQWLELVISDVGEFTRAELGDVAVIPVSSVTGVGLPNLKETLVAKLASAAQRQTSDVFRMPIDRVFTVRGTGTVVTGTVWSGNAGRQDMLRLLPAGRDVRVRGVQTHGDAVDQAGAGERAAFAVSGVDRADVKRGDVLVQDGWWQPVTVCTARVQLLPGVRLKQRQRVRIHLGTAEILARVAILADNWVQLRMEGPLVARAGDRFVIRSYSPVATVGGGQVAELGRVRKQLGDREESFLSAILAGEPADRIGAAVELASEAGVDDRHLPAAARVTPMDVERFAANLPAVVASDGSRYFSRAILSKTIDAVCADVAAHHARHPLQPGIERAVLLGRHAGALADFALRKAIRAGRLISAGSIVAARGFEAGFSPPQQALRTRLLDDLRAAGLAPPSVAELATAHRSHEVRAVLRLMEARGEVAAIHPDLYVEARSLEAALVAVRTTLGTGPLQAGAFKTALPVSRKYLIPLLEYLDRIGVTKREGDLRRVMPWEPQKLRDLQ